MQANVPHLFDYPQIQRARLRLQPAHPLLHEATFRLAERLHEMTRTFDTALLLAPWDNALQECVVQTRTCHNIRTLTMDDFFAASHDNLNLMPESLDIIISALTLSAANDVPGIFSQIFHALKPDGLLLMNLLGAGTLQELRASVAAAESALSGGMHPRVHPFVEIRDAGNLAVRAGFNLPVIDRDVLQVMYADPFALMQDLRDLGATNALHARSKYMTPRSVMMHMAAHYAEHFAHPEGGITATCELITLVAWKPAASQPKPLARGSAKHSLAAALGKN